MIFQWRGAAAALAIAAAAAATVSSAQRPVPHLTGRVIDAETGVAIPGVTIRLSGRREFTATTDREGRYWSDALPDGLYFVGANKDGYLPSQPQSPTGVPLRLRIRDGGALSVQQDGCSSRPRASADACSITTTAPSPACGSLPPRRARLRDAVLSTERLEARVKLGEMARRGLCRSLLPTHRNPNQWPDCTSGLRLGARD